jgi:hypothetical protein
VNEFLFPNGLNFFDAAAKNSKFPYLVKLGRGNNRVFGCKIKKLIFLVALSVLPIGSTAYSDDTNRVQTIQRLYTDGKCAEIWPLVRDALAEGDKSIASQLALMVALGDFAPPGGLKTENDRVRFVSTLLIYSIDYSAPESDEIWEFRRQVLAEYLSKRDYAIAEKEQCFEPNPQADCTRILDISSATNALLLRIQRFDEALSNGASASCN